jgi:hypothetical protein
VLCWPEDGTWVQDVQGWGRVARDKNENVKMEMNSAFIFRISNLDFTPKLHFIEQNKN